MSQLVKTINGLAIASVKTVDGLAIASVKTVNGLDNTAASAPAFVEEVAVTSNYEATASLTTTVTLSGSIAAGNRAVLAFSCGGLTLTGVTDSAGNTWAIDTNNGDTFDHVNIASAHCTSALNAGATLTLTVSGAGFIGKNWVLIELSGCASSGQPDVAVQPALSFGQPVSVAGNTVSTNTTIVGVLYTAELTRTYSGGSWTNVGTYRDNAQNSKRMLVIRTTEVSSGSKNPGGTWDAATTQVNAWVAYK